MAETETVKGLLRFRNRFLLLKKKTDAIHPNNIGKWECPGGRIEPGEKPLEALQREIREETGLKSVLVKQLPTFRFSSPKLTSVCHVFLLETVSDSAILSAEHSDYKWVLPQNVQSHSLARFADLLLEYFNNPKKYGL